MNQSPPLNQDAICLKNPDDGQGTTITVAGSITSSPPFTIDLPHFAQEAFSQEVSLAGLQYGGVECRSYLIDWHH